MMADQTTGGDYSGIPQDHFASRTPAERQTRMRQVGDALNFAHDAVFDCIPVAMAAAIADDLKGVIDQVDQHLANIDQEVAQAQAQEGGS